MREIPAEVLTLLKSRSMIGTNKPSCEVTVEGLGSTIGDLSNPVLYRPDVNSSGRFSYAQCKDGSIIVLYGSSDGMKLIQGYAADLESFIDNNSVSNTSDLFTGSANIRGTVFNDQVGDLYLAIARTRSTDSDDLQQVRIYKSTSGNGGDWTLHGTVRDSQDSEGLSLHRGIPIGAPLILPSGRWVLSFPYFFNPANFKDSFGVATSDDNGLTWQNISYIAYQHLFHFWQSRTLGYFNSKIWRYVWTVDGGGVGAFYYSEDDGATWTLLGDLSSHPSFGANGRYIDISFFTDTEYLYFVYDDDINNNNRIYKTKTPETITSWEAVFTTGIIVGDRDTFCKAFENKILISINHHIFGVETLSAKLPIKSININRNKNMAGSLSLSIDNKNGEWSPDNTIHQNVLFPNSEITVKQGYGSNLVQTFKGLIDRIEMSTFPQELKLSVRDKLKLALDQIITSGTSNAITYTAHTVEAIFTDLCVKAGLTAGTIEATGLTLTEKTFSWETYADCFSWLADLVGFEYGADETGLIYFRKDTIPLEPVAVYEFREGEDIISLGYTMDDNDLYSKVVVYGKDANSNVISAYKDYVSKDYYNVLPQKVMKIDASDADTVEKCQAIADRAEMLMRSRVREASFACIAVPWLQIGDLIKVIESSTTISEIYRVTDLSTIMDSNGYTMQIVCYHHSA